MKWAKHTERLGPGLSDFSVLSYLGIHIHSVRVQIKS